MSVTLTKIPNPFQPEVNCIEVFAFVEGKRLDQYIQDLPLDDENIKFVIAVNGKIISIPYTEIIIRDGDKISACAKTEVT